MESIECVPNSLDRIRPAHFAKTHPFKKTKNERVGHPLIRPKIERTKHLSPFRNLNLTVSAGLRAIYGCHHSIHMMTQHRPLRISQDDDRDCAIL